MNVATTCTLLVSRFKGSLVFDVLMIAGIKNSEYQLSFNVQIGQFALLKGVVIIYVCGAYGIFPKTYFPRNISMYKATLFPQFVNSVEFATLS